MRRALAVAVAFAALASPASAAELEVVKTEKLTPRLTEYTMKTPALAEETVVRVLLPRGYSAGKRYPVLYLLHGCCDYDVRGSQAWTTHGEAEQATDGLDLIVVMPDGDKSGFYTDWFNNGAGGPPMWETYHLDQLVPWVDRTFSTRAAREGRVLAGLSMGGFGAMSYAARHPDRFVAAASFSGAVDTNISWPLVDVLVAQDGGGPGSIWGPRATEEVRWRGHNPWDLAENLRGLHLELRAGNGDRGELDDGPGPPDPVERSTYEQSVSLHERFDALKVPHIWDDYGAGTHSWPYWARSLKRTLPELMRVVADPPAPPARVTYTAVEPEYEVYGWRVERESKSVAWTRLDDAARYGFTFAGSGRATVTTPPLYEPGAPYAASSTTLVADEAGRLHVPLALGAEQSRVSVRILALSTAATSADPKAKVPCASRRRFRVTVPKGLRAVRATVAGRRARVRGRKKRYIDVDLRARPAGTYVVQLKGRGRRTLQRTFRTCAR